MAKTLSPQELAAQEKLLKATQESLSPFEIHVMPQRFVGVKVSSQQMKEVKSQGGGSGKIVLLVFLVLIILGLLGLGAYFLYKSLNQPITPVVNIPSTTPTTPPTSTPPPATVTPVTPVVVTPVAPVVTPPVTPTTPVTPNTPIPASSFPQLTSIDTDADGLTDTEEGVYGTELRRPDTDNDGYIDGEELKSNFSPFAAAGALLKDSAAVNIFNNSTVGYSIFHPSSWLARATDESREEVVFTSSTGELFVLTVFNNPDGLTLNQWISDNRSDINPNTLTTGKTKLGLNTGLTPDSRFALINAPTQSKIYILEYKQGPVTRLSFKTTMIMMVNSFILN